MFTKRIIPCLDVNNGRVVKGVNFVDLKDAGDPVTVGAAYGRAGADDSQKRRRGGQDLGKKSERRAGGPPFHGRAGHRTGLSEDDRGAGGRAGAGQESLCRCRSLQ